MNLTLHVWRQRRRGQRAMVRYEAKDVSPDMSFLEMLDVLNEGLILKGEEPIAFEHDCREGICGSCGFMINGVAHGPVPVPRFASFTCAITKMATCCSWSRSARVHFRC